MNKRTIVGAALIGIVLTSCGTYYDPSDTYVRGVRWYDRGNYSAALKDWEPLAEKSDCDAQFRLGLLYFLEQGVKRDVQKTITLWTSAAERGHPRAQWSLGDINFNSAEDTRLACRFGCEGVKKDIVTAYKWYLLAEKRAYYDNDKKYIAQVLPRIRAKLTPEQNAAGEKLASEWKPNPDDCKPRELL